MKFTVKQPVPRDEIFAHDAFDHNIGKKVKLKTPNEVIDGTITGVKVADNGKSVELTYEIPNDSILARKFRETAYFSIEQDAL